MSTDQAAITLGILTDCSLVAAGVPAMLATYVDQVLVLDVGTDAAPARTVDVVLRDTEARDPDSVRLGAGWTVRHEADYAWPGRTGPPSSSRQRPDVPCVPKTLAARALVAALEEILATGAYAGPARTDVRRVGTDPDACPGRSEGLTEREAQIITLIVAGLSNRELSDRLYLGINTVKTYIRSAYQRMGVRSRSQAVLWGVDHGMRQPEALRRAGAPPATEDAADAAPDRQPAAVDAE